MGSARRDRCVLLCGMMGSGKTSVGRTLASRLEWSFIDTDERVERRAGKSIAEIFEGLGENGFRRLETEVLAQLPRSEAVIALGGGSINSANNREILREKGTLVWLQATPEQLLERVGRNDRRPLLAGLENDVRLERLCLLLDERREAYGSADLQVDTEAQSVAEVSQRVLGALGWAGAS